MEVFSDHYAGADTEVLHHEIKLAADNYFHFPSKEAGGDGNILLSNYSLGELTPGNGWRGYTGSDIGIRTYGMILFNLARKFWSVNNNEMPLMNDFAYASRCNENALLDTGKAVLDSNIEVLNASFPSTYLGGQQIGRAHV